MSELGQKATINNDELDLIELTMSIWKEKWYVIICTLLTTLAAIIYVTTVEPTYIINAQLAKPTSAELKKIQISLPNLQNDGFIYTPEAPLLQQQQLVDLIMRKGTKNLLLGINHIKPEEAFTLYLSEISSFSHLQSLTKENEELITNALGIKIDSNIINSIKKVRTIALPNTREKANALAPDYYTLSLIGPNRDALKKLIATDLKLSSKNISHKIKQQSLEQLEKVIRDKKIEKEFKLESLENKINTRISYLLQKKSNRISKLKQAYNTAKELGMEEPINETHNSLYLRGYKVLRAEINYLEGDSDIFVDDDLLSLKAQKLLTSNNILLKQLQSKKEELENNNEQLYFYKTTFNAPSKPIKPQKAIIIAISIIAGLILGFLAATTRVIIKKHGN